MSLFSGSNPSKTSPTKHVMYKDIITYQLAEGVTQQQLLHVAGQIVEDWMKKLPGFIKWEIHRGQDGQMTDVVYWESKEAAKNGEQEMGNIPNAADWFMCYQPGSISSKNLTLVAEF